MELSLWEIFVPLIVVAIVVLALLVVRRIGFRFLHRWADRAEVKIGDLVIVTFKTPSFYWCLAIALYLGVSTSELPARYVLYISRIIDIIVILSVTLATSNLFVKILENYTGRSKIPIPTAGIMYGVLRGTILIIGILITLSMLGISITPLITALGIGGLAVALALQDTLSNLFSGLNIIASMQLKSGDYIKLNTGEDGYIADIAWRNTTIKSLSNNMVIVPNSKLASAIITNYDLPEKEMSLSVQAIVGYGNSLEEVEGIALGVAKNIMETVPGCVPGFEPTVRYNALGESGIVLTVNLRVREFTHQYLVRHEFIKLLMKNFQEENVEIPSLEGMTCLRKRKPESRG
jgi:small-conductance mechanosensitive channel